MVFTCGSDLPLSANSGQGAATLSLLGKEAKSLAFINVEVSNGGTKDPIGQQDKEWTFQIKGPSDAILTTIGEPIPCSDRLRVSSVQSPSVNEVAVKVGVFQPRDFFKLRFIVANVKDVRSLQMDTGDLKGLTKPRVTSKARCRKTPCGVVDIVLFMLRGIGDMGEVFAEVDVPQLDR
jgi:hypothetical protein